MKEQLFNAHQCNAVFHNMTMGILIPINKENLLTTLGVMVFACLVGLLLLGLRKKGKIKITRVFYSEFDITRVKNEMLIEMRSKGAGGEIDFEVEVFGCQQMEEYQKIVVTATGLIGNRSGTK